MKKISILLAVLLCVAFSVPALAVGVDAISGTSAREVVVIGQYLGSFGADGERTGIFINLYENNKEAKAIVDTYPLPDNKSEATSKFVASAVIEAGGKVKIFGKELLDKQDGSQLLNIEFKLENNVATGDANYIDSTVKFPIKLFHQVEDYRPSEWAKTNFYSTVALGIVPLGLQNKPKTPITRGEFAELAINLLMKSENKTLKELETDSLKIDKPKVTFTDIGDNKYIAIAAAYGIVQGYGDGTYLPNSEISREEAAVLLTNLVNYVTKGDLMVTMQYIVFEDEKDISPWAKSSVQLVSKVGVGMGKVMNGVGDRKFDPKGKYTVEQSVLTMERVSTLAEQFN